ncbi:hypothetical protein BDR26DRAFT_896246 [Obelidium mucronatum]|nr:hypothetical protein BDR26DRAFT_896246 [Obelidium mucronatum]
MNEKIKLNYSKSESPVSSKRHFVLGVGGVVKREAEGTPSGGYPESSKLALLVAKTEKDITSAFNILEQNIFHQNVHHQNLHLYLHEAPNDNIKIQQVFHFLFKDEGNVLIYCPTRSETESLAKRLQSKGKIADFVHAGLSYEEQST